MYTFFATSKMKQWLHENMEQFQVPTTNKTIIKSYHGKTKEGGTFKINLYNTNTITIDGTLKNRLYEKLFLECGEQNMIGCDEVGVGDFFGPTVYVAVEFSQESINQLAKLHLPIRDSKKLKDPEIIEVYHTVKDIINFKSQIAYDSQIDPNHNSIAQKVFYHHKNCEQSQSQIIIDLFTTEKSFYKYSSNLNITWPNNIILQTKADSHFMTVALASIIARALFLIEMDKLNKKYNMTFPLGAGKVIPTAKKFIEQYSKDELATFCKTTFKTFNEI